MIDYISNVMGYIPLFAIITGLVLGIKFLSPALLYRAKQKEKTEKKATAPKSIFESFEMAVNEAPEIKKRLDAEIDFLMKKGATPEQLKSLKSKQSFVNFLNNDMVQYFGPSVLQTIKGPLRAMGIK